MFGNFAKHASQKIILTIMIILIVTVLIKRSEKKGGTDNESKKL